MHTDNEIKGMLAPEKWLKLKATLIYFESMLKVNTENLNNVEIMSCVFLYNVL